MDLHKNVKTVLRREEANEGYLFLQTLLKITNTEHLRTLVIGVHKKRTFVCH